MTLSLQGLVRESMFMFTSLPSLALTRALGGICWGW